MELTTTMSVRCTFVIMNLKYLFIAIVSLFVACNHPEDKSVYIGGEIINPQSKYVLLMHADDIVDTLVLRDDHTFQKRIHTIQSGLYSFKHGTEYQYLYLDPSDSIHLRLNTWDFDETLVFEGKGSEKNELLLHIFLENEKEEKNFYSYFALPEKAFQEKIDAVRARQNKLLHSVLNSHSGFSQSFLHLVQQTVNLPLYRMKELYPFFHKKLLKLDSVEIPTKDFYKYRDKIDMNDAVLMEHFAYQNYLSSYLYNEAYLHNKGINNDARFFTLLLEAISKKIENQSLKNNMLTKEMEYLFFKHPESLHKEHLSLYYNNCTDSISIANFKRLLADNKKIMALDKFHYVVFDKEKKPVDIRKILRGKPAVVYYKPEGIPETTYLKKRIVYLKQQFPDIQFIGIQQGNFIYDDTSQYYIPGNLPVDQRLFTNNYPVAFLLNVPRDIPKHLFLLTDYSLDNSLKKIR